MKLNIDDLIAHAGLDPRTITLERALELINGEARGYAGRAMAAVKLGKAEVLVTREEALAALRDWVTAGNDELTARTMRAGESAYIRVLWERGLYDNRFYDWRLTANNDLDKGEETLMSMLWPTNKRQAGRPARSQTCAKMLAMDVHFRLGAGEAPSIEKIVEKMTGRYRNGGAVPGITPVLVLPRGMTSHFTIHKMLRDVARDIPTLVEEARQQGEIVKAGGAADPAFYEELLQVRAILANPAAVKRMLKADRRANRNKIG